MACLCLFQQSHNSDPVPQISSICATSLLTVLLPMVPQEFVKMRECVRVYVMVIEDVYVA